MNIISRLMKRQFTCAMTKVTQFILTFVILVLPFSSFSAGYVITGNVQLVTSRLMYDRSTGTSYFDLSLKNISQDIIQTPVILVVNSVSDNRVTVNNSDGTTEDGKPYFSFSQMIPNGVLLPGIQSLSKRIIFKNPNRVVFTYQIGVVGQISVGPQGGTLSSNDGVKFVVPAGALESNISLTAEIKALENTLPAEVVSAGPVYDFGPNGTSFKEKISVTVPYYDDDDDSFIDGTDIPEKYVTALRYDEDLGQWLYLEKVVQDTKNKTITFLTEHFCDYCVAAIDTTMFGRTDALFFTIDGLDFAKTGIPGIDMQMRPSYLMPALMYGMNLGLKQADIYSYGNNLAESWSGDAFDTPNIVPKLCNVLKSWNNLADCLNKKIIIVTHSWGTILGWLALSYSPDVLPDLFITLSSPLGTFYVDDIASLISETALTNIPIDLNTVELNDCVAQTGPMGPTPIVMEPAAILAHNAIKAFTISQVSNTNDLNGLVNFQKPKFLNDAAKKWINYWDSGDIISGPLSSFYPEIEDRWLVYWNYRTIDNTTKFHAITSLDARGLDYQSEGIDGSWKNFLSESGCIKLGTQLRSQVENDILIAIGGPNTVTGTITSAETPIVGVGITLSGVITKTITTAADGKFSFTDVPNGNYTIASSLSGYIFSPEIVSITLNNENIVQNFTATVQEPIEVTQGLRALYLFNGNAIDESENGYDGTVYGASFCTALNGNENSAACFDGIDDYITIPEQIINADIDQFTFFADVEIGDIDVSQPHTILYKGSINGEAILCIDQNHFRFSVKHSNGNWYTAELPIPNSLVFKVIGIYHHGGTIELWVNGLKSEQVMIPEGTLFTADRYHYSSIGCYTQYVFPPYHTLLWNGKINEIRIYDRALNTDEINWLSLPSHIYME